MANKIFVSYKHKDSKVKPILNSSISVITTARHYVDVIEELLDETDHLYKGEREGEDIGSFVDTTIGSKLGDKIFDSSVTIVLISKGMKEDRSEKEQWIWEISYSLREQTRLGGRSKSNAILAVVLPDEYGDYSYFMTANSACNSITYKAGELFQILRDNMFNLKNKEDNIRECNGTTVYAGEPSYIKVIEWDKFKHNSNYYLEKAINIK
ncbi:hypothetical protein ERX46_01685 [Brumimicrobium glaciale]|uniref:Uncharacterized protein n=1 Tax=Brumimicrobium glaciale TaxID=200475 RepID=A0A4V1WG76_9FLAO|nr:TIR domain-containing protein [Brumimicrobium glaciale]RYM35731.1 hypothetical protein ERX46_01685 [Brumimicrobium glaciale]